MKFSPTVPLAAALAVGLAGAAAAQTTSTPNRMAPQATTSTGTPANTQNQTRPQASTAATRSEIPMTARSNGDATVRRAQRELHAAGLYNGPEDGIMDPDTRAAIANFQTRHGMRRTESLNPATLAQLNTIPRTGYGASARPAGTTAQAAPPTGAGGNTGARPPQR